MAPTSLTASWTGLTSTAPRSRQGGSSPTPWAPQLPFGLGSEAPKPAPSAAPPTDLVSVGRSFKRYEPPTLPPPHGWLCQP
eukprot:scaffold3474_cov111-Isochrysis_galbana.AAC.9